MAQACIGASVKVSATFTAGYKIDGKGSSVNLPVDIIDVEISSDRLNIKTLWTD